MQLWNNETEIKFFNEALRNFASPEQLFYKFGKEFFAYVPKNLKSKGQTLQSRNSLIGQFTEKWTKDLLQPIAKRLGLYAVNSIVCDNIALSRKSNADLALCTTDSVNQTPDNIKLVFEIKMSIVSNYRISNNKKIEYIGDYKSHRGNPSLLRSDSMLKAIGKSINIRVSGTESSKIPIIIIGNSPITESYKKKVDFLKNAGVIQGFWSINPNPTESDFIRNSLDNGFMTFENEKSLEEKILQLLDQEMNYFSSMISKKQLGNFIKLANREKTIEKKAEKFLKLIRER